MTSTLSFRTPFCAVAVHMCAAAVLAQAPIRTPQTCLAEVSTYEREQMASRAQSGMTYAQIVAGKIQKARDCVAAFANARPQSAELPAFARLQLLAGDTAAATATIQSYLETPSATEAARAEQYTTAIPLLISTRTAASFAKTEQLASQLDSLSMAATAAKVQGHGSLLSYYRAIDVDEKIDRHAERVIALAPSLDSAQRQRSANLLLLAYTSRAEVYGDRMDAPAAITLLTRGLTDLADLPGVHAELQDVRERYALVGTTAVPIVAKYWLNAPSGTTTYVPKGNVTLLEFSAHWCGPCRKSYPAIAALQEQFKARGLKTVFATNLYGFFHEREHLTPEQEIDVDREYFLTEHALPVQIAISPAVNDEAGEVDLNSKNYKVGGIPHIVVIDKLGVIRMIVIGWDPASKERLATMINSVL